MAGQSHNIAVEILMAMGTTGKKVIFTPFPEKQHADRQQKSDADKPEVSSIWFRSFGGDHAGTNVTDILQSYDIASIYRNNNDAVKCNVSTNLK